MTLSTPLSRRGVGYAIGAAALVAFLVWGLVQYANTPDPAPQEPAGVGAPTAGADADAAVEWLPHSPEQLLEAGRVAEEFAALYTSVTDGESTQAYYDALHEHVTADYAQRLVATAGTESAREQLAADGTTISAVAEVSRIRDLLPQQVTILVDCTTVTTTGSDQTEETYEFAVTMVPGPGEVWQVHDLQLADAGQDGDLPD